MKWIPALIVSCMFPVLTARAQTTADTAAIDSILFSFVVRDLQLGGDSRPPLRVPLRADTSSWLGRVHAKLRAQYPEFVTIEDADTVLQDRPGLTLVVTVRGFRADSGEAIISWRRCTTRAAMLNAYTQDYYFTLKKEAARWVFLPHARGHGDGHC